MTSSRAAVFLLAVALGSSAVAATASRPRAARTKVAPPIDTNVVELQVRLDRGGFSVGEIDGSLGNNTTRAAAAFVSARHLAQDAPLADVGAALGREQNVPGLATYRISAQDVAGPFQPVIPGDLVRQADLPSLGFRNALEALAEKLHSSPALLKRLNPGARFVADEAITAPDIVTTPAAPSADAVVVRVSKADSSLRVETSRGQLAFRAPVTTGSEHEPLPLGEWKVVEIRWQPQFHYNPDLFWDADPADAKATLPAGPNSPVGVVWIGIDTPHYGLHGTPEPSLIGHVASHGCVRMTNWDATRVATMVRPGTRVVFEP